MTKRKPRPKDWLQGDSSSNRPHDLAAFWDHASGAYPDSLSYLWRLKKRFDRHLVPKPSRGDMSLLDIGCGKGADLLHFSNIGYHCTGVDISRAMAVSAQRLIGETSPPAQGGVDAISVGDATSLPFGSELFDVVTCFSTIDHLPSREEQIQALCECRRIVRPGGLLVVTVPNALSLPYWVQSKPLERRRGASVLVRPGGFWLPDADCQIEFVKLIHPGSGASKNVNARYLYEESYSLDEFTGLIYLSAAVDIIEARFLTGVAIDPVLFESEDDLRSFLSHNNYNKCVASGKALVLIVGDSTDQREEIRALVNDWSRATESFERGLRIGAQLLLGEQIVSDG